ncbi:MAG: phosphoribosylanthranilate isomerase [Armatimonadetes bacterium]|nr:phosphoribosylanthranilate isomerase [Armatimonadota bacterium]
MAIVKICGITNLADAELAVQLGADMIGCVVEPSSPRYISPDAAVLLLSLLPASVTKVLVFGPLYHCPAINRVDRVQFLRDPEGVAGDLTVGVMRAMHLEELFTVPQDQADSKLASQIIVLEPRVAGQYGGTGQRVDWDAAARAVRECPYSVMLAGGLTPENVGEAISRVQPFGVDVSSGVERSPGIKDPAKLKEFIQRAKANSG